MPRSDVTCELLEEGSDVQAQPEVNRAGVLSRFRPRPSWSRMLALAGLIVAALFFVTSVTAYIVDFVYHIGAVLNWYDLNVYNDAGLITRHLPSILYSWGLTATVKFTYTPFAAVVFAGGSLMPLTTLRWLMTAVAVISIPLTAWLTLGGMGRRGMSRAAVALAVGAIALWTEPVTKALSLGQIEPLLLLLVVWDLTRPDTRWWKGMGIGVAAGIKLVPLIFIPYLLLAGKIRQAAVAAGTFAVTIAIGFIVLPGPSSLYWLTGYFVRPGRTGAVDALVNQSLLGMLARQLVGVNATQPVWLPVALGVALIGVAAGALLSRAGKPVQGWTLVGVTSVLVSPISWDHHWVWIVPFLAMLAGLAMAARGRLARSGYLVAALLTAAVFGSWPERYSGPTAYVPGRGLLGWYVQPPEIYQVTHLHGIKLLTWNLFAIAGCLLYLGMLFGTWRVWRARRPRRGSPPPEVPSETDALLARADAVLKGDPPADKRVACSPPATHHPLPVGPQAADRQPSGRRSAPTP
jgi:alpha-1,2-mannosyltransferase